MPAQTVTIVTVGASVLWYEVYQGKHSLPGCSGLQHLTLLALLQAGAEALKITDSPSTVTLISFAQPRPACLMSFFCRKALSMPAVLSLQALEVPQAFSSHQTLDHPQLFP